MPANSVIQLRRGTAAAWTSANPVLALAEPGYETDTGKEKRGDGSTAWNSLPYFLPGSGTYVPLPASPSDGQALVWNATSQLWVPSSLPGIELDSATVTTAQSTTAVSTWTTVPGLSITPAQSARPVYLEFNGKMTSTATGGFGLQIVDVTAGNVTLRYGFQGVAALVSSVGYLEWALRVRLSPNAASHNYVVQQFQAQAGTVKAFGESTAPLLFTATTR